jgi:hypothetical protein
MPLIFITGGRFPRAKPEPAVSGIGAPAALLSSQNKFRCSRWSLPPSILINSLLTKWNHSIFIYMICIFYKLLTQIMDLSYKQLGKSIAESASVEALLQLVVK